MNPLVKVLVPLTAIIVILVRCERRPALKPILGLATPQAAPLLMWVCISIAYMLGTDWMMHWRGPWDWTPWQQSPLTHSILRVLAVAILGPMAEELVCRGFLQTQLSRYLHTALAITIVSVAWAFAHLDYSIAIRTMFFGFGLLLGIARLKTNSVWTPIAMHIVWNTYAIW